MLLQSEKIAILNKLKPCPVCYGHRLYVQHRYPEIKGHENAVEVVCPKCRICVVSTNHTIGVNDKQSIDALITLWNSITLSKDWHNEGG